MYRMKKNNNRLIFILQVYKQKFTQMALSDRYVLM